MFEADVKDKKAISLRVRFEIFSLIGQLFLINLNTTTTSQTIVYRNTWLGN